MESVYLKTLVEVVRTGSISRAADILCVTQPAVSRRIKFMEDQYGCPLLDRTGRRLVPTEAGRLVYQKAQTLLEIESDLMAGLHVLGTRTKVVFGSTPAFGSAHLPVILREFMLACSGSADLEFAFHNPEQILQGLTEGKFDLGVMENCEVFDLSAFESIPLPDGEVVFASAPGLGLGSPETSIDALVRQPLFARREGCCSRTLLESNLRAAGFDVRDFRRVIVMDDLHLVIHAVLEGEGVTFLSKDLILPHLDSGRLVASRVPGFRHSRKRALVIGRSGWRQHPMASFVAALLGRFGLRPLERIETAAGSDPQPGERRDGCECPECPDETASAPFAQANRSVAGSPGRSRRRTPATSSAHAGSTARRKSR